MNLELLEEIHILKDEGISDTDISSMIGISKNNMFLSLRMENLFLKKYDNLINEIKVLKNEINSHIDTLEKKDKEIEKLQNSNFVVLEKELRNEIFYLKKELKQEKKYSIYADKYNNLPSLIKKFF